MLGLTFPAKITKVLDGDTVKIEIPAFVASVRLLDCWAAETRTTDQAEKQEGMVAKSHLQQLLPEGQDVEVHVPIDFDGRFGGSLTFGRLLARLKLDGQDVSEMMVASGHATKERS